MLYVLYFLAGGIELKRVAPKNSSPIFNQCVLGWCRFMLLQQQQLPAQSFNISFLNPPSSFVSFFSVFILHRRDSRRCLGSTMNRWISRCSKVSGESGLTSAPQRLPPALALSCTSPSSTARSSNSTLPKWVSVRGSGKGQAGGLGHGRSKEEQHVHGKLCYSATTGTKKTSWLLPQPSNPPVRPHQSHDLHVNTHFFDVSLPS